VVTDDHRPSSVRSAGLRRYLLPRLLIPSSFGLPPVVNWRGRATRRDRARLKSPKSTQARRNFRLMPASCWRNCLSRPIFCGRKACASARVGRRCWRSGPPARPSSQRRNGRHRIVCFFMPAHLACQSSWLAKISKKMAYENRCLLDRWFRRKGQEDMTMTTTVLTIIGCYSAISAISTTVVLTWGRARARRREQ
jgi:hypothetical protein